MNWNWKSKSCLEMFACSLIRATAQTNVPARALYTSPIPCDIHLVFDSLTLFRSCFVAQTLSFLPGMLNRTWKVHSMGLKGNIKNSKFLKFIIAYFIKITDKQDKPEQHLTIIVIEK